MGILLSCCCREDSVEIENLVVSSLPSSPLILFSWNAVNCIVRSGVNDWSSIPAYVWNKISPETDIIWLDYIGDTELPCLDKVPKHTRTACIVCGLCVNVHAENIFSGISRIRIPHFYTSTDLYWFVCGTTCYNRFLDKNDATATFFK